MIHKKLQMRRIVEGLGGKDSLVTRARAGGLLSAAAFCWEEQRINDAEVHRVGSQFENISQNEKDGRIIDDPQYPDQWEKILDQEKLTIWRRPLNDGLYEYKLFGTFSDISARSFYCSQTDFEFRKRWDNLIVKLDIIDKDPISGTEVIQWITHFPRPFYKREYIYLRKFQIDRKNNLMVIIGRATEHPSVPKEKTSYVRVDLYESTFALRPHSKIDENGFDYILTYSDDPKCRLPSVCYDWVAYKGVPDYLDKLHDNAVSYAEQKKGEFATNVEENKDPKYKNVM